MKNSIVVVADDNDISKFKEVGYNTFLFPFKGYCVGFDNYYDLNDIVESNSYLYINRILTNEDINNLKVLLFNVSSNIKGVFFQDLGLIEVLKDTKLEKILFSHHLTTNYKSINYYLNFVDSVVLSTDITIDEMKEIINVSSKKICIYKFGLVPIMYSRRTLVTNYKNFYNINDNIEEINEPIKNMNFRIVENEYGTVIYPKKFYLNNEIDGDKVLFNIINPYKLSGDELEGLFNGKFDMDILDGFLHTKTIYKLPPKEVK